MTRAERKRQRAAPGATSPQCIIASCDGLARKAAQALGRALGQDHVQCQSHRYHGVTTLYFFTPPLIEAEIQGQNRPVLPLPQGQRWLHVAINLHFIAEGSWRVNHISVGLLQGDPSVTQKESLLRAEWHIQEREDDSGHAQPHWHVLGATRVADPPMFNEIVEAPTGFTEFLSGTESDAQLADADPFGHFHYAMVSDWHRTPSMGPRQVLEDETAVVSWLQGCVGYICHQLEHVDRKGGRKAGVT